MRDAYSQVLELIELPSLADQRAVLVAAHKARIANGWQATDIGWQCAFFFATRAGERIMVSIERDPRREVRR